MKKVILTGLIFILAFMCMGAVASASGSSESVDAVLNNKLQFKIDGAEWTPTAAPISYNGTTYLPVRAISVALGLDIKFEASTNSIIIVNGKNSNEASATTTNSTADARNLPIKATLNRSLKFQINGESWTPTADPISYKNTTYLPVRALSNALGLDIKFNPASNLIAIQNGEGTNTPVSKNIKPLFETQYESGGYTLHTGSSNKLTFNGKKYSKALYSDTPYVNMYVYPKGAYSTLTLHIASMEQAIVKFKNDKDEVLKSVTIPKGKLSPVELDVSKIKDDHYVTVSVVPFYNNHDEGAVYIFDTSFYSNEPVGKAVIPDFPKTLALFDSQYEIGGYTANTSESSKIEFNGQKYDKVLHSPGEWVNFYIYPKGEYKTFVLQIAATEDSIVVFRDEKDTIFKTATIVKNEVTAIELDVSKFTGEKYVTIHVKPANDGFEGEVYVFDTSTYK
ncbi:MAG: copper amine oxidase N-terminal domain-containing protein [Candidatus Cohnella colombiensis]|uniref:Copper amine oxidase N-terminal domain-containing protein n=1 Tax=Candidatus Cohnella colombiensis TaxID=3121368 RepID=A0AA95EY25_9BACL|nr:MAG: copper amine oxidase N-terminal domain-containing protein [Cohnella sp.]